MKNKRMNSIFRKFARAVSTSLVLAMLVGATASASTLSVKDVFDAQYYSSTYSDLSAAFGTDAKALYNHYLQYGQNELRTFTKLIDLQKYREAYADLDAAFGDDWNAYLTHYLVFGINEGRDSFGLFDARSYADRYPDLKEAFGYDVIALYQHYITYGINEGRNCERPIVSRSTGSNAPVVDDSTDNAPIVSTPEVTTSGALRNPETGEAVPSATVRFTWVSALNEELASVSSGDSVSGGDSVSDGDVDTPDSDTPDSDTPDTDIPVGGEVVAGDGWYEVTVDANGNFVIENLPAGNYSVTASAPGYMTLTLGSVAVGSGSGAFQMPTFELLSADRSGNNDVVGTVVDATTGQALAGVTLKIRSGWNNYEGEVINTATTNASGAYSISLARGYYTIEFVIDGYTSTFVNVFSSNANRNFNGTLNPYAGTVSVSQLRVVLTWNEVPRDLDSHIVFTAPELASGYEHVYYGHKQYFGESTDLPEVSLDVDDVSSYGPETVTVIEVDNDKKYFYSVYDFTNGSNDDSTEMSASGANVKVYQGSELVREYNVPTNQAGNVWNVFKVVNGQIIDLNVYNADYETMYGDFVN
uniref:carboxypeptidase regulatory-like domain-containing protein n=1 Tax=Acetatifactor sp. TaxID=1872090 RepID=UPI0040573377